MWLASDVPLDGLAERIQAASPPGLRILGIEAVEERGPALQSLLESAEYEVTLADGVDADDLRVRLESLMESSTLPRERRGKQYDLRPLIEELILQTMQPATLKMRLAAREGATGRPDEVLAELGIAIEDAQIERTRLIFREPVAETATKS